MEQCNKQEVGDTYKSECSNGESRRRREAEYLTNALDDVDDDYPDLVIDPSVYDETIQQVIFRPILQNNIYCYPI